MYIHPNNEVIENLIDNYASGHITTIYGNAASGKTTCCLLAALSSAKKDKVIFVDTESGFDVKRIEQLDPVYNKVLNNIFLIQPKSYQEQHDTIIKLKEICDNDKIKLIIVDTIGNYYRNILNDDPSKVNKMLINQMKTLVRIARDLNKIVIVTNQVYAKMNSNNEITMVGGNIVLNMSKCIIELNKTDLRYATLTKYKLDDTRHLDKKIKFEIKEKGLFIC